MCESACDIYQCFRVCVCRRSTLSRHVCAAIVSLSSPSGLTWHPYWFTAHSHLPHHHSRGAVWLSSAPRIKERRSPYQDMRLMGGGQLLVSRQEHRFLQPSKPLACGWPFSGGRASVASVITGRLTRLHGFAPFRISCSDGELILVKRRNRHPHLQTPCRASPLFSCPRRCRVVTTCVSVST